MAVSLLAPVAYVVLLFGPLWLFSKYYMGQKQLRPVSSSTSWFPQHYARDIYISLLSQEPACPQHILTAALLRRAMTDVERIIYIQNSKSALNQLLQKSLIGDTFYSEFLEAERELEAELKEVVEEANTFDANWGKFIFAQASDMVQHDKFKKIVKQLPSPMPNVQIVQQQPGQQQQQQQPQPGQMQSPQRQGQPGAGPGMLTPEQQRQLAAKMTPQQMAALQQFAQQRQAQQMMQQQQQSQTPPAAITPPIQPNSAEGSADEQTPAKSPSKSKAKKGKGKKR